MDIYSLDIGGSSIKHGLVRVDDNCCKIIEALPTITLVTRSFSEVRVGIVSAIAAHVHNTDGLINVAISTTGAVARSGLVWNAGHFSGYNNIDWHQILQMEFPSRIAKVVTVNDGKASTWAEYQRVGLGTEIFVHFVVGTGVGGGIVFRDRLLYGDAEAAGALGHMKVSEGGDIVCSCGHKNCVETLASAQAIARYFAAWLRNNGGSRRRIYLLSTTLSLRQTMEIQERFKLLKLPVRG